ncbi:unnamed protein product [Rotaria sordida]|uniref:Uncharacterized protein n=1 Tax=Rotaria sordida TaxID=392033 RepID=A0A819B8Z2_9BILA|nr:unnamed protein product [Rotaria sordida]CAF3798009.1 unnamed protein product [Rotaria sordida]
MLHPSSGRINFNVVSEKSKSTNNNEQSSTTTTTTTTKQDQNVIQPDNKIEIETKTKDAINNAIKLQSSNNSTTTNMN